MTSQEDETENAAAVAKRVAAAGIVAAVYVCAAAAEATAATADVAGPAAAVTMILPPLGSAMLSFGLITTGTAIVSAWKNRREPSTAHPDAAADTYETSTAGTTVNKTIDAPVPVAKGCWTLVELSKQTGKLEMLTFTDANVAHDAFMGSPGKYKALFDPKAQLVRCEGWQEDGASL
ncbi:hypothetical protein PHYBOEH_010596 [Phytophthora boehmeriae]|uniref:Uncharacterized protein n=1 Tax=Phytophthora boehmeriae TaxID=109152 RepID=A0A8T1VPU2_9STRA|nr:hypothetical protein PHYBOEH_010596 [Phytophthora boehmeriae]